MSASKISILARALVLFGIIAQTVIATAPLSDSHFTETAAPQEIGSITADGSLVYSMNYCTIVHNTDCQVSLSTGGAAPPPAQSTVPDEGYSTATTGTEAASSGHYWPPTSGGEQPSAPGESTSVTVSEHPGESGAPEEPTASVITTTDAAGNPTTLSEGVSATHSASASGDESASKPHHSGTKTEYEPTSSDKEGEPSGTASGTPTAGAVFINAPSFVFGIAGLVAAMLF